jgi:membrane fusion protein, copper/silver efflux system
MKNAFEGQRVSPQDELYVVADLSTIWVQARVYEYELPHVELGQPATVTIPALPGREYTGKVVFIQPTLDEATRTVQVRVELPKQHGEFKPGMFANIEIHHTMGEGLLVPTSAVIRAGEQEVAFRVQETNRFGDRFHVLKGLRAGDRVVTSANFLIDSESRLRLGGGGMAAMPGMGGMDMGGMNGMDHSKMKH